MRVKLCGFTEATSLQAAIDQKCDFVGFIFYEKSPRYITPQNAKKLSPLIPTNIAKVAVVVDASFELLSEISQNFQPDFFQFHGTENVEYLQQIRQKFSDIKIIKAFRINNSQDLAATKIYENDVDFFLFDSSTKTEFGGSGKTFDWKILQNFTSTKNQGKKWFLSGGLNINNIDAALKITGANMVDISSGIEESHGKKSPKLITEFMQKVRKIC